MEIVDQSLQTESLAGLFRWLDERLEKAVSAAQSVPGARPNGDPFRGLYITQQEVERLIAGASDAPGFESEIELPAYPPLIQLRELFQLSAADEQIIVIALAPEVELRYERIYSYLQDDVTRKRPTVELCLKLFAAGLHDQLDLWTRFSAESALVRHGLLTLVPDPHQVAPPQLAHYVKIEPQVVRFLLGQVGLDGRLARACELATPIEELDALSLDPRFHRGLIALCDQARTANTPLALYLSGTHGPDPRQVAEAMARKLGRRLLVAHAPSLAAQPEIDWQLVCREAQFQDALLYLDSAEGLTEAATRTLANVLKDYSFPVMLSGMLAAHVSALRELEMIEIPCPPLRVWQRELYWQKNLARHDVQPGIDALEPLAERFQLSARQIARAAEHASAHAQWRAAQEGSLAEVTPDDLYGAARAQSGHGLEALAHKIEPRYDWQDIVLPDDTRAQLQELCDRVAYQARVLDQWGFAEKLTQGKGVNALFAGPSGTGKTMAAEIIARTLGLDLYRINLSGVVSKYIGETEKNLDRIFEAAADANAILFFDEADALFGKRSEVRDSHDRYANIEISYLLQKMELYEGVTILATNLRGNLDEAFTRRLAFAVYFPFPDVESRLRIWRGIFPAQLPLAEDVPIDALAQQLKLSGGNIKNIALAAAFLAASDGGVVTPSHLYQATRREYQKMGKLMTEAELEAQVMEQMPA